MGAQHGAKLADAYPRFVGKGSEWFADDIHPNDPGHAAIAAVFADAFAGSAPPPPVSPPPVSPPPVSAPQVALKVTPRSRCTSSRVRAAVKVTAGAKLARLTLSLDGRRLVKTERARFHVRRRVRGLRPGRHRFKAVAVDETGARAAVSQTFRRC